MKNKTFKQYLEQQLKNPAFRKEWNKNEVSYQITKQLIKARIEKNMSQRTLAIKTNTTQAVISRIENMTVSPTANLLARIANSLGKKIEIKFN